MYRNLCLHMSWVVLFADFELICYRMCAHLGPLCLCMCEGEICSICPGGRLGLNHACIIVYVCPKVNEMGSFSASSE